ncbi:MAG TPA: hypothetical protein VFY36_12200 [Solirubrobacteraceae bacterium]|nr:hypothetical protein [Solirubrobacteraceae bacterium]
MQRSRFVGVLAATAAIFSCATASALAAPEAPTTEAAEVIGTTAHLKGVLNPGASGEAGSYEFLYKLSATECENESSTGTIPAFGAQEEQVLAEFALQPSATYSFCLLARNEAGETAVSSTETFTTAAAPPAIDAEGLASVGGTSAGLSAQINSNNQETTYKFEYSTQATGQTLEGTVTEVPGAEPLAAVFGDQYVEVKAEPLQSQTQYYWRVVATNASAETTTGNVETFTTPLPPETPTIEPVELEGLTAKLKGVLNPNQTPEINSSYEFLYRLSATECEGESSTGTVGETGVEGEQVSAEAPLQPSALQPSATYSFCLLARNQVGETALSSVETVTTPAAPPAIDAESSSSVSSTAAALSGQINPNNQETNYAFEYSTDETLESGVTQIPGASPLSGFGDQAVETKLESLQPRTQYFWRITATNASVEATSGNIETFTTLDAPLATTGAAQGITRTTAAISGTVNPGGLSTRYNFVYVDAAHYNAGAECPQGQTCAYGEGAKTTPSEVLGASDYETHPVGPQGLGELKPGTTYHYALVASNSEGGRVGSDQTFTTSPAAPPSASTGEASGVSQLSATITGAADTRGLPGTLSFQVALSPEGGSLEPASVVGSLSGTSVTITFSFGPYLQPETTYYYRAVATNADGTAAGEWRSFTTGGFPSPFPPSKAFPLLNVPFEQESTPKPITNAQKRANALKKCHKLKKKSKRKKCERAARRKYAAKHT